MTLTHAENRPRGPFDDMTDESLGNALAASAEHQQIELFHDEVVALIGLIRVSPLNDEQDREMMTLRSSIMAAKYGMDGLYNDRHKQLAGIYEATVAAVTPVPTLEDTISDF